MKTSATFTRAMHVNLGIPSAKVCHLVYCFEVFCFLFDRLTGQVITCDLGTDPCISTRKVQQDMKKSNKTFSTFVGISAAMALVLTGCASNAEVTQDDVAGNLENESDGIVVGYDSYFVGNTWSAQLEAEFLSATERQSGELDDVIVTQSDNDAQTQISNVQSMIAREVDVIILTPISPEGISPVLEQAYEAGIDVFLSASGAETDMYTSYINVDDREFGSTGAEWLVDKLDGEGRIIVLNGITGIPTSDIRYQGAQSVFDENPGIEIVTVIDGGWDQATAKTAVESVLDANPNIDGVWSQGGSMTLGAIEAFEAADVPLVPMTGEDSNGLLKKWSELAESGNSNFDCIAVAKPTWISAEALDSAIRVANGQEVQKINLLEPEVITEENLGNFVRPDLPDSLWVNTRMTEEEILDLLG